MVKIDNLVAVKWPFPEHSPELQRFWEGLPSLGVSGLNVAPMWNERMIVCSAADLPQILEHAAHCGLDVEDLRKG